jgi:ribA/ribD-fused uncharacterized protein
METPDSIYFYSHTKGNYSYMSNFYPSTFVDVDGILYNCTEQYLMYHKCKMFDPDNAQMLQQILHEKSPAKIKALGRKVKNYNEHSWDQSRYQVMINGLKLKFGQNQSIANKLIQTNPKMLYEAAPTDNIWGIGFDAETAITKDKATFGSNLLGLSLVQVRTELIG